MNLREWFEKGYLFRAKEPFRRIMFERWGFNNTITIEQAKHISKELFCMGLICLTPMGEKFYNTMTEEERQIFNNALYDNALGNIFKQTG